MADVRKEVSIHATVESVWAALTDAKSISAWMDDDSAKVDLRIDGCYAIFGGETTGCFTRIEAPTQLEYTWHQASWQKDWQDSVVKWTLSQAGDTTLLTLVHTDFPNEEERDSHDEGWDVYWLEPMKAWLES